MCGGVKGSTAAAVHAVSGRVFFWWLLGVFLRHSSFSPADCNLGILAGDEMLQKFSGY